LASSGSQASQPSLLLCYAIDKALLFPINVVAIDNEEKVFQFKGCWHKNIVLKKILSDLGV
jgi:hypothetical protein